MVRRTPENFPKNIRSHYSVKIHGSYKAQALYLGWNLPEEKSHRTEAALRAGNEKILKARGVPQTDLRDFNLSLDRLSFKGSEFISAFIYNDYLSEQREETLGNFLDNHWERIHKDIEEYRFVYHKDTFSLVIAHSLNNFALTYKAQGFYGARNALDKLSQSDVRTLIYSSDGSPIAKPSVVASVIESKLAKARGDSFKNPTELQVRNRLYKAYSKAVLTADETVSYSLPNLGNSASQACNASHKAIFDDPVREKIGEISSTEALAYANFLFDRAEDFGPQKIVVLIQLLNDPNVFGLGHKRPLRDILLRIIKEENAQELLLSLIDLALNYKGALPTAKEWAAALDGGVFAFGSGELLAELLTDTSKDRGGALESQRKLRSIIGLR